MKKYLPVLFLIIFLAPSIALASWWNPFSWFKKSTPVVQKEESQKPIEKVISSDSLEKTITNKETSPVLSNKISTKKMSTPLVQTQSSEKLVLETWEQQEARDFASADAKGWTSLISTNQLGEKRYYRKEGTQWIRKNTEQEAGQPLNTTLCNGQYWNNCPSGQQFYCPISGDAQCNPVSVVQSSVQYPLDSGPIPNSYSSLGRNKGEVVFSKSDCDYYIVETSLGYSLLEWYGGFYQDEGDIIYGNLNNYGFKDITNDSGRSGKVWIDDWMLSESSAIEKYYDKCD